MSFLGSTSMFHIHSVPFLQIHQNCWGLRVIRSSTACVSQSVWAPVNCNHIVKHMGIVSDNSTWYLVNSLYRCCKDTRCWVVVVTYVNPCILKLDDLRTGWSKITLQECKEGWFVDIFWKRIYRIYQNQFIMLIYGVSNFEILATGLVIPSENYRCLVQM